MASKLSPPSLALIFALNLLFFFAVTDIADSCQPSCSGPTPPSPSPPPPAPYSSGGSCPVDALKWGVCADVLSLAKAQLGHPPHLPCCELLGGLVDLEAAVCLCTAIKANVLGKEVVLPVDLTLILNYCGKDCPSGFQCA